MFFILLNVIAIFHAYKLTHFSNQKTEKTKHPSQLTSWEKLGALIFGVNNPRPVNDKLPEQEFQTIRLEGDHQIECWYIPAGVKGSVILFHGYAGKKSGMLDKANVVIELGYNALLIDFMGTGNSEGDQTTIGYFEAEQVKTAVEFLTGQGEKNIYLFGTSMGAVAIMKAIDDYRLDVAGIIIECPFGSMYETVCARFRSMKAPTFPMAGLLVFWGGVINGFPAFQHNPSAYAKNIAVPALLMYGERDDRVSRKEIDEIFSNLAGKKTLRTYPFAGHENYLIKYRDEWTRDVGAFLK